MKENNNNIVIYQTDDGMTKIDVKLENGTVWLSQQQMADLYDTTKQNISLHIKNIFDEEELDINSTVKNFLIVQKKGNRREIPYYNLDTIISIGFRVNSKRAIKFRTWANKILYNYYLLHADLNNVDYLIKAKKYNIFHFAHDLETDEIIKINNYINSHIPNQIKNCKMIYSNNKIIGCLLVESKDDGVIIDEIYLQDGCRNKGIGSNIIKNILLENSIVYLWVYKENLLAIKLYKSLGFYVIEETKTRYYMKYSNNNTK